MRCAPLPRLTATNPRRHAFRTAHPDATNPALTTRPPSPNRWERGLGGEGRPTPPPRTPDPRCNPRSLARRQFQWVTSSAQRAELDETLHRPKFTTRYELTPPDIAALLAEIDLRAELIASSNLNFTVRDPVDTPILASAVAGNAEFLVTGDNDLLVLAEDPRISPLRIVTPSDFLARLP